MNLPKYNIDFKVWSFHSSADEDSGLKRYGFTPIGK